MTEIIAEIGSNWGGSVELGKRLIKECKDAGASAVKMQFWHAKDIYPPDHPYHTKRWGMLGIEDFELTQEKAIKLKGYADSLGIEWFCSVFNSEDVDFLESLKVKRYKVATSRNKDRDLLARIAETKKPVIVSMEQYYYVETLFEEVGVRKFKEEDFKILWCVSKYPCTLEDLKEMPPFGLSYDDFQENVLSYDGYSNHYPGIVPSLLAVSRGASIVEVHVKMDEATISPDASCSITISQLKRLVRYVKQLEAMT